MMIIDWNTLTAARTLWQEARGEPLVGQQAVAHVLINRLKSRQWGTSLAAVCLARSQFSAWGPADPKNAAMVADFRASCALADNDPTLLKLVAVIQAAQTEPDPTGGATAYYAKNIPTPYWAPTMLYVGDFGNQHFFKPKPTIQPEEKSLIA